MKAHQPSDQEFDPSTLPPSKSQRKRDMTELQKLGLQLAALPASRIAVLDVPEKLRDALREASRITAHEGRRRHLQYIGKLMRQVDAEPLREALLEATGDSRAAVAKMHALEDWRTRLLDDDSALTGFIEQHPQVDPQELRQLLRAARAEKAAGKPPRHYRAIYQRLKDWLEPAATTEENHPDEHAD